MTIYKFILGGEDWVEIAPDTARRGCIAIVIAESEEKAREALAHDAGFDARWLPFATVQTFDPTTAQVVGWAQ